MCHRLRYVWDALWAFCAGPVMLDKFTVICGKSVARRFRHFGPICRSEDVQSVNSIASWIDIQHFDSTLRLFANFDWLPIATSVIEAHNQFFGGKNDVSHILKMAFWLDRVCSSDISMSYAEFFQKRSRTVWERLSFKKVMLFLGFNLRS